MKASIIIPSYNSVEQLNRALQSIIELSFDSQQYEIIVVDNGSKDNTNIVVNNFIKLNAFPKIRYIYDDIPGLLTGRHRGAKEALSDVLVFVDQDIDADKGWLTAIVDTFNRHSDVHLVGGKCLPKYEKESPEWVNYFWNNLPDGGKMLCELSLCDFGDEEKEIHPAYVFGLNFSIRKSSLYELGGFHPDAISPNYQYFQGDGETGLSLKMLKKGYKAFYNPKALVYHEVPASRMTLDYFDKRYFYQGVCDSFTEIRRNNGITSITYIKRRINNLIRFMHQLVSSKTKVSAKEGAGFEKEMLFTRFRAMEKAGYNFHQEMAKKNLVVMEWVLKENYWDYSIPGFITTK